MRVLVLGETGKIGHIVSTYLKKTGIIVYTTSRYTHSDYYFDPTKNLEVLETILEETKPQAVINCIGVFEEDMNHNYLNAIISNYQLPHYLNLLSKKHNFKYIHISPREIFKKDGQQYTEKSKPNNDSRYGKSISIENKLDKENLVIRTKLLPLSSKSCNVDLLKEWEEKEVLWAQTNKYMKGITTLELARCIKGCLSMDLKGVHHVFYDELISEYEWLCLIKDAFSLQSKVKEKRSGPEIETWVKTKRSYPLQVENYKEMLTDMYLWVTTSSFAYPDVRWIKRYEQDNQGSYKKTIS